MKKYLLPIAFVSAFFGCSDSSSNASDSPESSSSLPTCSEKYEISDDASWVAALSDKSYLKQEICDRATIYLGNFFDNAYCSSVNYNESKKRFDVTVFIDDHEVEMWAPVHACNYWLDSDYYTSIVGIGSMGQWSASSCLCKITNGVPYYQEATESITVKVEKPSSSSSAKSSSSLDNYPSSSSTLFPSLSSTSSSSVSSSSTRQSSSSVKSDSVEINADEESKEYSFTYTGLNTAYKNQVINVPVKSNCLTSDCKEDFEKFNFETGTVTISGEGFKGKAAVLDGSDYIAMPWFLDRDIQTGSLDFYYRQPEESLTSNLSTALVGNNGARLLTLIVDGKLYFYKNFDDEFNSVSIALADVETWKADGWNRITAEWDDANDVMALFVNGTQVAFRSTSHAKYQASTRAGYDNAVFVGYKDKCCVGSTLSNTIMGYGSIDEIEIKPSLVFDID